MIVGVRILAAHQGIKTGKEGSGDKGAHMQYVLLEIWSSYSQFEIMIEAPSRMSEIEVRGIPSAGQVITGSVCEKDHKGCVDTNDNFSHQDFIGLPYHSFLSLATYALTFGLYPKAL